MKDFAEVLKSQEQLTLEVNVIKQQSADRLFFFGCLAVLFLAYATTRPLQDFIEYWTSAHELIAGRNPYSLNQIMQLEKAAGWDRPVPLMNLNPPWSLPFIAPLGLAHSYTVAFLVWTAVLAFTAWWATRMLFDIYSPGRRVFRSDQGILAFTFFPAVMCLKFSQTAVFVLLGLTGFLWFERRNRDMLAGLCLAMAAIKPQLLYLFWAALLLECWRGRKWKMIASLAATLLLLAAIVTLVRPQILSDYWVLSRSNYVKVWPSALGGIIRFPFGYKQSNFYLQFMAPIGGILWFAWYRTRERRWDWSERLPLLLTVSVLTSVYGWYLDQILLLIPIVAILANYAQTEGRVPRSAVKLYTGVNLLSFAFLFVPICGVYLAFLVAPPVVILMLRKLSRYSAEPAVVEFANDVTT